MQDIQQINALHEATTDLLDRLETLEKTNFNHDFDDLTENPIRKKFGPKIYEIQLLLKDLQNDIEEEAREVAKAYRSKK